MRKTCPPTKEQDSMRNQGHAACSGFMAGREHQRGMDRAPPIPSTPYTWLTFSIRSANWYFPMDMTCAPATVQRMHAVRDQMMIPDLPLSTQLHCCRNLNLPRDMRTHTSIQTEQKQLQRLSFSSRIFMTSTPPCPTTSCPPSTHPRRHPILADRYDRLSNLG